MFPNDEVVGAIHTVLAHPTNADILYLGSVNGGVWRTTDATATSPHWEPIADQLPVNSIGAMAMDPTNPNRIVAGAGRFSSFAISGPLEGLILTDDGGDSWRVIDNPLVVDRNVSGIAVNQGLILVAAGGGFYAGFDREPDGGLLRSVDGGQSWTSIEVVERDPDFPDDPVQFSALDLVSDPSNANRYYVSVRGHGVYVSEDRGATWENITESTTTINDLVTQVSPFDGTFRNNNTEMAVASNGRIYIAVLLDGQANYIGFSDDQGSTWDNMDLPVTPDQGGTNGLNPSVKPGGQGSIHFSITVDPSDPKTVYVGGDRQDGNIDGFFGNFIGATEYTGRLFRGDTRIAPNGNNPSPQWEHLTHRASVPSIPGGGTRNSSAPHADSREMVFDANRQLIEVDDGGIFRRTSPQNNRGDWFSLVGDLQVTEIHDIAYDSLTNTLLAGTQDNGVQQQLSASNQTWQTLYVADLTFRLGGDGGDVAIDDTSMPGYSFRYSSSQFLGFFRRQMYNSKNELVEQDFLVDPTFVPGFVTPVDLNNLDQKRMVISGQLGFFESVNRGDSFRPIPTPGNVILNRGAAFGQNATDYGGRKDGKDVPYILYVGSADEVLLRSKPDGDLEFTSARFPGAEIRDLVMDPLDWNRLFVADRDRVYYTANAGRSWSNITGNLGDFAAGDLRSIEAINKGGTTTIVLGTDRGVYITAAQAPGRWAELGTLPHAPVFDIEYDKTDDVLAVGTMGRGSFVIQQASSLSASVAQSLNGISGVKFNDLNSNGVRDAGEPGMAGFLIYVDLNGDDRVGVAEPAAYTDANGNYRITNIPDGRYAVREVVSSGFVQTAPVGGEYLVNVTRLSEIRNIDFGNAARPDALDYNDGPASYGTASHVIVSGLSLGSRNDGEPGPQASDGIDDDGVTLGTLTLDSTATVSINARHGAVPAALVQLWIDFNGDGTYSSSEQVLKDRTTVEGTNTYSFSVPAQAVGSTFARARYGYERGIGPAGAAIAGEVEDYAVTIVGGGGGNEQQPVAVGDSATVMQDSPPVSIPVLNNDQANGGSLSVIEVSMANNGGNVSIAQNAQSLIYAPASGFVGIETFTYTISNGIGTSTATVTVTVQPDTSVTNQVQFTLQTTDSNGIAISQVTVGQNYQLRVFTRDVRTNAQGVFAAYLDVVYPSALTSISGPIVFGTAYPNDRKADLSQDGLINDAGAFAGLTPTGSDAVLVMTIPMTADEVGTFEFSTNPAEGVINEILVFGSDAVVPANQILYGSTSLTSVPAEPSQSAFRNAANPLDVNADGIVSAIDPLLVINELNGNGARALPSNVASVGTSFIDVSGDNYLSSLDALLIINYLNQEAGASGEPDAASAAAAVYAAASGDGSTADSGLEAAVFPVPHAAIRSRPVEQRYDLVRAAARLADDAFASDDSSEEAWSTISDELAELLG